VSTGDEIVDADTNGTATQSILLFCAFKFSDTLIFMKHEEFPAAAAGADALSGLA
jgi:hypothetical protein